MAAPRRASGTTEAGGDFGHVDTNSDARIVLHPCHFNEDTSPTSLRLRALVYLAPLASELQRQQQARGEFDEALSHAITLLDLAAERERGLSH